jgi:hypothetical protein
VRGLAGTVGERGEPAPEFYNALKEILKDSNDINITFNDSNNTIQFTLN